MEVSERTLLEHVSEFILRYSMFESGQRVGVAVSGGADSVALLHVLVELAPRWNLALSVLHLDHGLRGAESRSDAGFVAELAAGLGLPVHMRQVDVHRLSRESGDNLEQAARRARSDFFRSFLRGRLLDRVALGHTRSDQAETVLFRFLRGAGTAGLAGIWPVTEEGLVRPLLAVSRNDVELYLESRGLSWRNDSSNEDLRFARNRIRRSLLPELTKDWNPALLETLAQMATIAQDEERYWREQVDQLAGTLLTAKPPAVLCRVDSLKNLPRAVSRRLIRRAIQLAKGDLRQVDFPHVERILCLAGSPRGHGRVQLPGLEVVRSLDWIRLAPAGSRALESSPYSVQLSVPGRFRIPGTSSTLCLELAEGADGELKSSRISDDRTGYNNRRSELDWGSITGGLELRNWRPGDRFQPTGHIDGERMKILFREGRIPSWDRAGWPIITNGDTVIWAKQFGVAEGFASTPRSTAVLRVWEQE
jgi:tRNA(Ile)-lysidine synthase